MACRHNIRSVYAVQAFMVLENETLSTRGRELRRAERKVAICMRSPLQNSVYDAMALNSRSLPSQNAHGTRSWSQQLRQTCIYMHWCFSISLSCSAPRCQFITGSAFPCFSIFSGAVAAVCFMQPASPSPPSPGPHHV